MRQASSLTILSIAIYLAGLLACHTHAFSLNKGLQPPPYVRRRTTARQNGVAGGSPSTQPKQQLGIRQSPNPFLVLQRTRPWRGGVSTITFLRSTGSGDYLEEEESSERQGSSTGGSTSVTTITAATGSWNPLVRKIMGGLASIGVLETAYLTFTKLQGQVPFCPATSETTCSSVLTGSYAQLPGTSIPLAALGLVAYGTTLVLALGPLLLSAKSTSSSDVHFMNDMQNPILLTAVTTTMGVFSVFLMSLLFGVLHQSCLYCVTSAVLSIFLTKLAWLDLPDADLKRGAQWSLTGGGLSLVVALLLFVSNDPPESFLVDIGNGGATASRLLASTSSQRWSGDNNNNDIATSPPYSPPAITTTSSPAALRLANELQALDAAFYGAFWCSHCYDQKQTLGQQAMSLIPYVECSRDGVNANTALCARKQVPGYPTWEIAGQLYPGEQALEELQEIVTRAKATAAAAAAAQ